MLGVGFTPAVVGTANAALIVTTSDAARQPRFEIL